MLLLLITLLLWLLPRNIPIVIVLISWSAQTNYLVHFVDNPVEGKIHIRAVKGRGLYEG